MRRNSLSYDRLHVSRSRELRSEMSVSEQVLWKFLRRKQLGFGFKRQVPFAEYYRDFYCAEACLCVEVEGEQHVERTLEDARRDSRLQDAGVLTIRVPSLDLFDPRGLELSRWLERIQEACEERSGRPAFKVFEKG